MQEHFEKVIGRLRTLEGLVERLQTVESLAGQVSPVKIVSVQYAEFTGTQSASVVGGGNVAITSLSIAHAMTKSTNKIWLLGQAGSLASSNQYGDAALAAAVDGALICIGDSASSRTLVGAGSHSSSAAAYAAFNRYISNVYEPASISSMNYTLRAINMAAATKTIYVNRTQDDNDSAGRQRTASSLTLIELEG